MNAKRITDRSFFTCPAEELAPKLLGKILCRPVENRVIRFRLTEVEAYCADDTACHSNKYKTGNGVITQHMVGGTLYVHYKNNEYHGSSFDIVANTAKKAESVLIRGGMNIDDVSENYSSQPTLRLRWRGIFQTCCPCQTGCTLRPASCRCLSIASSPCWGCPPPCLRRRRIVKTQEQGSYSLSENCAS